MKTDDLVKKEAGLSRWLTFYMLGLFGMTCLFAWWWGSFLLDVPEHEDPWGQIRIAVVIGVLFVIALVFLGSRFLRRGEKRNSVRCPYCDRELLNHIKLIVASGNCCYCGRHLPEEAELDPANLHDGRRESDPLFAQPEAPVRAEFIRKTVTEKKERERAVMLLVLSGPLIVVALGLMPDHVRLHGKPIVIGFLGFCLCLMLLLEARSVRKARRAGFDCLHCKALLKDLAPYVIATGNCPNCGERVLPDEPR